MKARNLKKWLDDFDGDEEVLICITDKIDIYYHEVEVGRKDTEPHLIRIGRYISG